VVHPGGNLRKSIGKLQGALRDLFVSRDPGSFELAPRSPLIASMLLASGISSQEARGCRPLWVMYKNEAGKWQVIEPAAHAACLEKVGTSESCRICRIAPIHSALHFQRCAPVDDAEPSTVRGQGRGVHGARPVEARSSFAGWVL
jgi:hypothetical protein